MVVFLCLVSYRCGRVSVFPLWVVFFFPGVRSWLVMVVSAPPEEGSALAIVGFSHFCRMLPSISMGFSNDRCGRATSHAQERPIKNPGGE